MINVLFMIKWGLRGRKTWYSYFMKQYNYVVFLQLDLLCVISHPLML